MTFTREDAKRGLFSMKKGKSPGNFSEEVQFITLIPKVPNPVKISQFCPIALSNTTTKLVSKVLVERLKKDGVPISHLLFADETGLFGEGTEGETRSIMSILHQYELLSGQLVRIQNSAVKFSPNVGADTRAGISSILGMKVVTTHGTYLGLPSSIGTSQKEVFASLVGRLKSRIADWKPKLLSKAGKSIFITSVLLAIPTFVVQCFRLPINTCQELNSLIANYWDKVDGGLGFRDNHAFNMVLLSKHVMTRLRSAILRLGSPAT
ncbi:hypothetical protein LIER_10899 [Lithospermum erythrorhizon]|uniref:Reverse transcriptase n=1 Tax=Lithospermum erythrorhizon TaxID=34254 RepID=A0AAV3PL65_LITER